MKRAVLALVLASCSSSNSGDDYPIGGGSPGPINNDGSGGGSDGGVGDGGGTDGGVLLTGRVCLLTDLRKLGDPKACATTGADNLTVSLGLGVRTSSGTRTTTTAADGTFSIVAQVGAGFTWHVVNTKTTTDPIVPTAMLYGTVNTIPAIKQKLYEDLVNGNGGQNGATDASIIVRVVRGTKAVSGLTATTTVPSGGIVLYDTGDKGSALTWDQDQTDTFGIAWLTGLTLQQPTAGTMSLNLTGTPTVVATRDVVVEQSTITFATIELPAIP